MLAGFLAGRLPVLFEGAPSYRDGLHPWDGSGNQRILTWTTE